jgi:hypothetical protein
VDFGCEVIQTEILICYNFVLISVAQKMVGDNFERSIEIGYVGEPVAIYELNCDGTSKSIILMK